MKSSRYSYLFVAARLIVGAVVVFSAATKLIYPNEFATAVRAYDVLPAGTRYVAMILPWVELVVGCFVLLGLFSRIAIPLAAAMLAFFLLLMGVAFAQGKSIDCGCFVGVINEMVGPTTIIRDLILLGLTVPAYLASPQRLSLDVWLGSGPVLGARRAFTTLAAALAAVALGALLSSFANDTSVTPPLALAIQSTPSPLSSARPSSNPTSEQPTTTLPQPWRLGPSSARVVITEFGDYQCPACRAVAPILKQLVSDYHGEVALVYRHFPLSGHPFAAPAAFAAEAAGEQGKFWEMHELMFADQQHLSPQDLRVKASYLKLDLRKFDEAMQSERVVKKVQADFEAGIRAGLKYTPWIMVNNEVVPQNSYQAVKTAIDSALTK